MPSFVICGEIKLKHISSPGTRLKCRYPLFLRICVMGGIYNSMCYPPVFPMCIAEKFRYSQKIPCDNICDAICMLEKLPFSIELRQEHCFYPDGELLAYFDSSVSDITCINMNEFQLNIHNRELLMIRSFVFQGISPKIVFSTNAALRCDRPFRPRPTLTMRCAQRPVRRRTSSCSRNISSDMNRYLNQRYNYSMSPCPKPCPTRCCRSVENISCCYSKPRRTPQKTDVKKHWKCEINKISENLSRANDHINRLIGL